MPPATALTPAKARSKNLTAAKRSLGLIDEAAAKARAALDSGRIPGDGLLTYAFKYETALQALWLLDSLGAPEDGDARTVEVSRDDLESMVLYLVAEFTERKIPVDPGTPLANLAEAAGLTAPAGAGTPQDGAAPGIQPGVPAPVAPEGEPSPGWPPQGS